MDKHPATANFQAGMRVYKLVLLGEGGVGKSALTLQFVSHSFLDYHDPTIEDAYQQQTVIDNEVGLLDILDTAGQQEFTAMREQYMRTGEGFIIIYSITDRRTFEEASRYKQQILRVRPTESSIPMVVVGNKYDLEERREVSKEEGRSLAKEFDCPFFETSAALRHFVDDVFHQIVREIRKKERDEVGYTEKKSRHKVASFFRHVFRKKKKA